MNKGTILLVTLWILAILSLLAIGIGFRSSIELKLTSYQTDSLKAYEIARAGVVKALNELQNDDSPTIETLWACGIALEPDETQAGKLQGISVGEGRFDCFITDLQRKVNLNTVPKEILKRMSPKITDEIADNIRAWRGDSDISSDAINKDYPDKPYECKNAPFNITEELLLVKDMPEDVFYGEEGIKNSITVYGPQELKININTADEKALDGLGLGQSSQNIIGYRGGEDMNIETREDNRAFTTLDEVKEYLKSAQGGGWDTIVLENLHLENFVVFGSDYFEIRSTGALNAPRKMRRTVTCVVKRTGAPAPPHKTQIIGWTEE
ncbi:MAG: type II secretion system protein GspK [Candidatus Omnitrophica bacterium]|nr:type II secretion system protein GspK [Candidatus Omnitrophota bacterium]